MFEKIKGFFANIFEAIVTFFENIFEFVKSTIESVLEAIENLFDRIVNKIKAILAPIIAWLHRFGFAMFKAYCRVVQAFVKIGNYFLGYRTPKTLEGAGSVLKLPRVIKDSGVDNILVVCGPHIAKSGMLDGLLSKLDEEKVAYTVFSDLQANPTDENVETGLSVFRYNGCGGILAFGGGSPMDCAKAIAARNARPRKSVAKLQGLLKVHKKTVPLWAVPTTSGTGSETTLAAVVTEAKTKHKASINDPALMPKMAVLDPALTVSMSARTTATTAMDALCHAVEAYTNGTYNTRYERKLAKQAVKLIYENVYASYCDGKNLERRQNLQKAAFYAGRAFTRGGVGYVHACGHPLSALYGLSHSQTMAILLPKVMRTYGEKVYKRLAELADVCGILGATDAEKAEAFIRWIEETNDAMGIAAVLPELQEADIPQMVKWAQKEACPLYPVPVILKKETLSELYRSVMAVEEVAESAASNDAAQMKNE